MHPPRVLEAYLRVLLDASLEIIPLFVLAILVGALIEEFVSEGFIVRFQSVWRRFRGQVWEYAPWVVVSLLLAALVDQLVPNHWIEVLYGQRTSVGSLLASLSGVPFYFCSGAELPLVKELLSKGMGFGPAIAMMLAVPIVNLPTLGVVGKWIGPRSALIYLALIVLISTLLGTMGALI